MGVVAEVDDNGLQFVPYAAADNTRKTSLGRHRIKITKNGKQVATLTARNGLYFAGEMEDNRYADYQAYVVSKGKPKTIQKKRVSQAGCRTPVWHYQDVTTFAQNNIYNISTPSDDPFQWSMAFVGVPATVNFNMEEVAQQEASLSVDVAGMANVAGPDHTARVSLNGISLGTFEWDGQKKMQLSANVPAGRLQPGENTLEVSLQKDGVMDLLWIDSVTVSVKKPLRAQPEGQSFDAPAGECIEIGGLIPDEAYTLLDVTNSNTPVELIGFRHAPGNPGTITFNPTRRKNKNDAPRRLLPVARSDTHQPAIGEPFPLHSPLKRRDNYAEYLIVTHPLFTSAAEKMAAFHAGNGMDVKIVTTNDAYNAFNT